MKKQKQDPQIEWGFHAVIPRLVRTDFEKLTPVQKWLYVCLKDLCGEHGTCYRALRVLATETGISIGMLSESIRSLHDAGLIHAEKKRRNNNPTAKEVWHITIVDIWQANAKVHPTKRSQNEHYKEENVHTVNNNVHTMNDIPSERSPAEQKRSHSETEEESLSSIITEAVSLEAEGIATSAEDRNAPAENVSDFTEWKRKTDPQQPAVTTDTAYHIANSGYEKDDEPTEPRTPAVALNTLPSEQKPVGGKPLSLAATPPGGGQDDAAPAQATLSPVSLSTLTPAAPSGASLTGSPPASPEVRQGGRVIPRRPRGKKPVILEITMNGMLVKGWYESARGSKIRMTEKNVAACNTLGDDENVTCLSLKAVIEHLDGLTWVKEHDFAIDIQVLADDTSRLNFEKNWPVVKRKLERRGQQSEQIDFDDYVGNGPEERAKRRVLIQEMKARGELIS